MTLDYVYYCGGCDFFCSEEETLNEGGYNVCPECLGDSLRRFSRDEVPTEVKEDHGFPETKQESRY